MICNFSVKNFKAFADEVKIDFFANKNIKRFDYNYLNLKEKDLLKTIGFYGPNNTGKTCILFALVSLRNLMINENHDSFHNVFADLGTVTSFKVEYYINDSFYVYKVDFDNATKEYLYESLSLKYYDGNSSKFEKIFERSVNKMTWNGITNSLKNANLIKVFSLTLPFMVLFNDVGNEVMMKAKNDYIDFANSISYLKMDGPVDITKTISLIQNDQKARNFIKEFVKNCDLHIDDFGFDEEVVSDADINDKLSKINSNSAFVKESLKFFSKHNGYRVPSIFFDSVGTLKLVALSGYIYEALKKGKTLIIDEIDSSLHHILTKSIVAMFNNMLNKEAQLVFTTHDALLLDLKNMFRKDQIYLVDIKNSYSSKITRLSEFTSRDSNGIRGDENIIEYYLKGQFGSIPTPDLFSSLEEVASNE